MARLRHPDLLAGLFFLLLPLVFFHENIFGGRLLLPADNLFQWEPWRSYAAQFGVTSLQNQLLSDLILENYPWKRFIVESLQARELPLWNPHLFAGVPFLAAGQHSAYYPLTFLFFALPIGPTFAYLTVANFFLGGFFMYLFLNAIGAGRVGGLVGGVAYAFSGFMVVSVVFPMVVSAAIWLPLLLFVIEKIIQRAERGHPMTLLWPIVGAVAVALQFFAGHIEISLYVLIVSGYYTACRLLVLAWRHGWRSVFVPAGQALALVAVGGALAAVQMVPLYELVTRNFRQGSASYEQVISWAFSWRQVFTFLIPDFWGNPSHTGYFDLITGQYTPVTVNYHGEPIQYIMASLVKNYVEAGSYLGVLPLALALIAVIKVRNRYTWAFLGLAIASLLFTFGAPTYKILFYLVPGWNQLHTPFRWVFPYTVCTTVLAGLGAGWLAREAAVARDRLLRGVSWGLLLAGGAGLLGLALSFVFREQSVALADRVLARMGTLQAGFASGQMLYSYQFRNLLIFACALLASGLVLLAARRGWRLAVPFGGRITWRSLAVGVVTAELFVWGGGFNPATAPALLEFVPPAIEFLKADDELYRITGYGDDSLHPNAPMIHGISDIRGYDSIIPKQYTDFMGLIEEQGLLAHNRIARLGKAESLDSPLLDLLNVKYVATEGTIDRPGYRKVYDGELRLYLNEDYLPRAFVVHDAILAPDEAAVAAELTRPAFDPRKVAVLEEASAGALGPLDLAAVGSAARVEEYKPTRVTVRADMAGAGLLVLADSYFPGWRAFVDGQEVEVLRADYNFRAVYLPAGEHEVVFRYVPNSFVLGGFTTLVATGALILALIYALWNRYYREEEGRTAVQRVFKNSGTQIAANLGNKLVDFAFAMVMLRWLGPEGVGKYAFAIVVATTFEIITNFGLSTLTAREVARDKAASGRYFGNTVVLRLILWLVGLPFLGLFLLAYRQFFNLADDTILATLLLALALVPGHVSAAASSLFVAHERMEYPAGVSVFTTLAKVTLGLVALLAGYGFVGLAGVSIVVNLATALVLLHFMHRLITPPRLQFAAGLAREMLGASFPLMINILLAVVFFRIDTLMLQPLRGDVEVGWYNTAYKFIDGLNIVPATFTFAVFPLLARYAASARDTLYRSYYLSLRYLLIVALPIVAGTVLLAEDIILFFGGPEYLPASAVALQLLILFLPFSFINSITQYVLIALDEQRQITRSFLIAVPFNIVGNLLVIPFYGFAGAAVTTILSEIVLMVPFMRCIYRHLPQVPFLRLTLRPLAAALAMGLVVWLMGDANPLFIIPVGAMVYLAALVMLGTFDAEDKALFDQLLHGKRPAEQVPVEA